MSFSNQPQYNRSRFGFPFQRVIQTPASGPQAYTDTRSSSLTLGATIANAPYYLVDGYNETNAEAVNGTTDVMYSGAITSFAQSFTPAVSGPIYKAGFFLGRGANALTGNVIAKLYTAEDVGDGYYPVTLLATSNSYVASALSTTRSWAIISFPGGQQYNAQSGTTYCMAIEYTSGDATHYVTVGMDLTGPTCAGTMSYYSSATWTADSTGALIFKVYR